MYDDELREAVKNAYNIFAGEDLSAGKLNELFEAFELSGVELKMVAEEDDDEPDCSGIDTGLLSTEGLEPFARDVGGSRSQMFAGGVTTIGDLIRRESAKREQTGVEEDFGKPVELYGHLPSMDLSDPSLDTPVEFEVIDQGGVSLMTPKGYAGFIGYKATDMHGDRGVSCAVAPADEHSVSSGRLEARMRAFIGRPASDTPEREKYDAELEAFEKTVTSKVFVEGWVKLGSFSGPYWENPDYKELLHTWLDERGVPKTIAEFSTTRSVPANKQVIGRATRTEVGPINMKYLGKDDDNAPK